jgi:prepilin-type N-terminal cleavage/methylation domain-containing protein
MKRRAGFTLTELLIVIGILLLLSTLSLAVYNTGRSSDRMRSAARVAQSAFLGAKDRAMHAKNLRGIRLIRDSNGPAFSATNLYPALVNGFTFLQPISHDPYLAGTIQLERLDQSPQDGVPDGPDILVVRGLSGANGVDWDRVSSFFGSVGQIRIPATTGQWYNFTVSQSDPYKLTSANEVLILSTPFNASSAQPFPANYIACAFNGPTQVAGCEIQFGSEVLPFHQPIALPTGAVIDLRYCSQNVIYLAGGNIPNTAGTVAPNIDFSFSPRGSVSGATGGIGALYFCLRDLEDAMSISTNPLTAGLPRDPSDSACKGDCLVLALYPATGLVQTYPADLTDAYINSNGPNTATNNPGQDGIVDNLFSFAQLGKAAGH